jgi:hypothetical protein
MLMEETRWTARPGRRQSAVLGTSWSAAGWVRAVEQVVAAQNRRSDAYTGNELRRRSRDCGAVPRTDPSGRVALAPRLCAYLADLRPRTDRVAASAIAPLPVGVQAERDQHRDSRGVD